ncbi:MAG: hypothetical protein IPO40_03065 [Fibrobacteres bacterium]|nr:hypothetical protein [Fibrobacterota bacterium]
MTRISSLVSILFVSSALAQDPALRQEICVNAGWSHPLGTSLEYAADLGDGHVLGVGAGFSLAGGMFGLDARRYFQTDRPANPYLGVVVSKATGLDGFLVVSEKETSDTAVYDIEGGLMVAPRLGLRISVARLRLHFNGGYGFVLSGGGVTQVSGKDNAGTRKFLEMVSLGGPEFSASGGIAF